MLQADCRNIQGSRAPLPAFASRIEDVADQEVAAAAANASEQGACPTGCFVAGTKLLTVRGHEPIERIGLGRRMITGPDEPVTDGPVPDPEQYLVVALLHVKPDGSGQRITMSLLRHVSKVEHLGAGDTVRFDVLELEAEGTATVMSVEPAPEIEQGPGRLVTGTIRTNFADVRHLKLERLDEPLGVTGSHPLFSEDEQDFVPVSTLGRGDRLRTRSGLPATVESVSVIGANEVFNLEIEEVHKYYVSSLELLAHNAGGGPCPVVPTVRGTPVAGYGITSQQAGQLGEDAAGIIKNTRQIPSITETADYRTPDILDHVNKIVGDVKNVSYQGFTRQLQDSLYYALANDYSFVLIVRQNLGNLPGTVLSKNLQNLEAAGFVTIIRKL